MAFLSIIFILLSIATFTLRTLTIFEIVEYDFIDVYIDANTTVKTPVHNTQRRDTIAGFNVIEWTCMKLLLHIMKELKIVSLGNSWFIFEITLRFIVAPSKKAFCFSILNWIGKRKT